MQISINAALKRNQIIYILKVSLLAVGVSIIPPVLLMHRKISKGVCIRALIAIVILWALFVASTLWSNVNRHPLYFDRFIFKMSTQPTETSSLTWEERASLNKTLSCYDASKDTAEKQDDKNLQMVKHILKSLKEKKTAMVEEEDFRSADELAALIREVETGLATGDSKAGFSSIGTLSARVNQINSRKNKDYQKRMATNQTRIRDVVARIKKYQEEVREKEVEFKKQDDVHQLMGDLKELADAISSSTRQVSNLQEQL